MQQECFGTNNNNEPVQQQQNNSILLETAMETTSSCETARLQEQVTTSDILYCPSRIIRSQRCFPTLLEWSGSNSSPSVLSTSLETVSSRDDRSAALVPWDERDHTPRQQQAITSHHRQSALVATACTSATCTACRQPLPVFVPAATCGLPPRAPTPLVGVCWRMNWVTEWNRTCCALVPLG